MFVLGQHAAQRSFSVSYERARGWRSTPDFTGTRDAMLGIAARLGNTTEWDVTPIDVPLYGLFVREPKLTDGTVVAEETVTWELLGNAVQKDIFEHPKCATITPDSYVEDVRRFFEQDMTSAPAWMGGVGSPPAAAVELFQLMLKGTRVYQSDQYVLRKSQVVPFGTNIELGFAWTGLVLSSDQMIGGAYNFGIPLDLVFSVAEIVAPVAGGTPPGFTWGWLKRSPQVEQMAGSKWRIQDEYWFECWSTFLYTPAPLTPP